MRAMRIRARQIQESDIAEVVALLADGFKERPRAFWSDVLERMTLRPVPPGSPQYGYLLESDAAIVGAILLIFSTVRSDIETSIRCNVSSWFVQPAFRGYATLLVSKALSHKGVTYLNITPASHTLPILQAQGYANYNTGTFIAVPALASNSCHAQVMLATPDAHPSVAFDTFEHETLLEHAKYGCISLWCTARDHCYPFVFRFRNLKWAVPCAQLIYCRKLDDLARFAAPIGRFLAARGRLLVVVDSNGPISGLVGHYFDGKQPKFFKGPNQPRLGDLLYTERAMFGI
jgi:hypothetical protein